ncbi:MAG TPA: histidine phosphatase family protein [Acidimicrobiales bacterium]|nr:histidine phosphatase family protein [Acidimicrobiales bacterium]
MDGTRIVLVRHGESRAQELGIVGGHRGCRGLSERGRLQVEALRDRWKATGELGDVAALYASVMPRAVETAEILAPAVGDPEVVPECTFCEHHPGEGDGLPWEEFERRYPVVADDWDPDLRRDPGGETYREMAARVAGGLDRLVERHAGETVVVASHGGVIVHSLIRWLLGENRDQRGWLSPENTSITEWRFGPSPFARGALPWELVRFNDRAHLLGFA